VRAYLSTRAADLNPLREGRGADYPHKTPFYVSPLTTHSLCGDVCVDSNLSVRWIGQGVSFYARSLRDQPCRSLGREWDMYRYFPTWDCLTGAFSAPNQGLTEALAGLDGTGTSS
jgi:hypothetical protein